MIISPILVEISENISSNPGDISLIFTFFTIGMTIGQLSSIFIIKKIKKILLIIIAYFTLILLTTMLIFVSSILVFFIIYLFSGYILGIIWIMGNTNVLESRVENKNRILVITLSFYPAGAFIAPLISSFLTKNGFGWRSIYYVVILFLAVILALFIAIKGREYSYKEKKDTRKKSFTGIFKENTKSIFFSYLAFIIFTYSVSEIVVVTWLPTFFRITCAFDVRSAGLTVSIY